MKIALVHDYLGEFGGAERVLEALAEIYPDAPIYTAFFRRGPAWERFKNRDIRVSWAHYIPGFSAFLYSPLRFLAPLIWNSFNFSGYDIVITSASWYVTKGVVSKSKTRLPAGQGQSKRPIEICYCHTPPRYLYGYQTSIKWDNLIVRVYSTIVNHFMRLYDWNAAQRVDWFIANSREVAARIKKFYRRDAVVIYPPVSTLNGNETRNVERHTLDVTETRIVTDKRKTYYLIVSRIVGGKGLELAVEAANKLKVPLKVVGSPAGYSGTYEELKKKAGPTVEFLGFVSDEELAELYAGAKAFLALARDEDFGITPVEAMAVGTPVVAFAGGGYLETVVDPSTSSGQAATGTFFEDYSVGGLVKAIKKLDKMSIKAEDCINQAKKFSKERFKKEIENFVNKHAGIG